MSGSNRVSELEEELSLVRAQLARLELRVTELEADKKEEFVVIPSEPATDPRPGTFPRTRFPVCRFWTSSENGFCVGLLTGFNGA